MTFVPDSSHAGALTPGSVAVNSLVPGLAGQFIGGTTPAYLYPPGTQLDYVQSVAIQTSVITVQANATVVLTTNSITYDGTPIKIEVYTPALQVSAAGSVLLDIWDGSTDVLRNGINSFPAGGGTSGFSCFTSNPFTPSAGAHVFTCRLWVTAGTGTFAAGAGTAAGIAQSWMRTVKV